MPRSEIPRIRNQSPTNRRRLAAVPVLLAGGLASAPPAVEAQRLFAEEQDAARAVEALVAAFAADPESSGGRTGLWQLARRAAPRSDLVEAVVSAADGLGSDGWVAAGVLLRRAFRPLDALEAFDRAAAANPHSAENADLEAGRMLAELRSNELALARFGRHPEHPGARHGRAVVLARTRRTEEAFALTEALLREEPENPTALLLRAELLDSTGRGSEALDSLRRLMEANGSAGPAAFRLARILVRQGGAGEALPILEAVVRAAPDNAEAWLALGRAYRSEGRRAAAREALGRALDENPALNEARIALARLLARDGEQEAAERLFTEFERRKAISNESGRLLGEAEHRPDDFSRVQVFVNHALSNGDIGLALRGAQRFLIEFPAEPERHLLLARVFREGGSFPDAERVLRRGLIRFLEDDAASRRFEAALSAIGVR